MKKIIGVVLILLLTFALFSFTACGLGDVTEDARMIVDDFYDAFSDEDYDDIVDLLHENIVDDFGGKNATEDNFEIIHNLLGDIEDYKITSFDTEKSGSESLVEFTVDAEYESGYESEDTFEIYFVDDEIMISAFEIPAYKEAGEDYLKSLEENDQQSTDGSYLVTEADVKAYIDDYYYVYSVWDIDTLVDYMHPDLIENLEGEQAAWDFFSSIRTVHGDITHYSIVSYNTEPIDDGTLSTVSIQSVYANGDETLDTFEVYTDKKGYANFSMVDIPTAGLVEALTEAYLDAFGDQDLDALYSLFAPSAQAQFAKADSDTFYSTLFAAHGLPLEVTYEEYSAHIYQQFDDGTIGIFYEYLELDCEIAPMYLEMYYSVEDGVIGILDLNYDVIE